MKLGFRARLHIRRRHRNALGHSFLDPFNCQRCADLIGKPHWTSVR